MDEYSPFRWFLWCAQRSAKTREIEFLLDLPYLKELWERQGGICPYTGIKMKVSPNTKNRIFSPDWASLDRIDSDKGYIKGNVQFVCMFINFGKNKFSDKTVKQFIQDIREPKAVDAEKKQSIVIP